MLSDMKANEMYDELKNFLKCIKGNPAMFLAICEYAGIDGHRLDPECCAPIDKKLIYTILRDAIAIITDNRPINGKPENWSCGCFGSRWLDIDPRPYDLDYIRCAFYSKKTSKKDWKHEKPYAIQITIEKGR
jgi:hypothetical protein